MRSIAPAMLIVALFGFALPLRAYEVQTHEAISETAAFSSVLAKSGTLEALGLAGSIDSQTLTFPSPTSTPKNRNIRDLIKDGANFEDKIPRPLNHFFDPINDTGFLFTSPKWALEDTGDAFLQRFSFRDARKYFLEALGEGTQTERFRKFGLTLS